MHTISSVHRHGTADNQAPSSLSPDPLPAPRHPWPCAGTSPSDNWSDPNTTKPRGAMTHLDIERERQAFREQHSKQAQAGGKQVGASGGSLVVAL